MHIKTNIYYAHKNKYLLCENKFYNICDELETLQLFILLQLTNLIIIYQRPRKWIIR